MKVFNEGDLVAIRTQYGRIRGVCLVTEAGDGFACANGYKYQTFFAEAAHVFDFDSVPIYIHSHVNRAGFDELFVRFLHKIEESDIPSIVQELRQQDVSNAEARYVLGEFYDKFWVNEQGGASYDCR